MSIIQPGMDLIETEETLVLFTYDDAHYPPKPMLSGQKARGTPTIGYGHTGPEVVPGLTITSARAVALLNADIAKSERDVDTLVKVPINDYQRAALVSFDFNVGGGDFKKSTLLKKLNKGDYESVPAQMAVWNHTTVAGKLVVSDGLTGRRAKEGALWKALVVQAQPGTTIKRGQSPSAIGKPAPAVTKASEWITPGNIPTIGGVGASILASVSGNGPLSYAIAGIAVVAFIVAVVMYVRHKLSPS